MRRPVRVLVVTVVLSLAASPALPQRRSSPLAHPVQVQDASPLLTRRASVQGPARDPLRNGTLLGAIIGGAATFAFGMYLCSAIREEGDPPCLKPALLLGAAGAGAGAAAGAGIDALRDRRTTVRVAVRF